MKPKTVILLILTILILGVGVYFKDYVIGFYDGLANQAQKLQKTDIASVVTQVSKQLLTPPPLSVGGSAGQVVLLQSKIITETNLQRQENGNLLTLVENQKLDEAAAAKANDMFVNQYFEHVSPTGVDPGKLVQDYGYEYIVAGENLILGNFSSEKEVVADWMASPGHRANILNNRVIDIGVAIVKGTYQGQTVWIGVQEFGLPLSSCAQPEATLEDQITLYRTQLDLLTSQIEDKKSQINSTNPLSGDYRKMVDDYNQLVAQYNALAEQARATIVRYNNQVNIFNKCVAGS